MLFRHARTSTQRWASALVLLALLAQLLAAQLGTRHAAAMLLSPALAGQICTSGDPSTRVAGETQAPLETESGMPAGHCPVCAITALSSAVPTLPALVPLRRPAEVRLIAQSVTTPPFEAPAHLLPPAQGPPAVA